MREVIAVVLAALTASRYALSTSVQALEARRTPPETALRPSLLGLLVRSRRWRLGTAAGAVAWPLQAAALAVGSVALVQPALGFGLVVLLALGVGVLHERIGAREVVGVLAIAAAVAVLGVAAPHTTGAFTRGGTWLIGVALLVVAPAPYVLRALGRAGGLPTSIVAGLGWAWVGLGTSLVDSAVGDRHWFAALAWAIGVGLASWGALLAEMTSLQRWSATRAVPIAFGLEMLVPAVLAPIVTDASPAHPVAFGLALALAGAGAVTLGASPLVAHAAQPITAP